MVMKKIFKGQIFDNIQVLNEFLIKKRNEIEDIDEELRVGINLSIILNSVCYLEGAIEAVLKEFVSFKTKVLNKVNIPDIETRKEIFSFYNPLMEDLEVHISITPSTRYQKSINS